MCRLVHLEPAEEAELDDARLPGREGVELLQRIIERNEVEWVILFRPDGIVERHAHAVVTLLPAARAGMIDKDAANGLRCHGEELGSVLPACMLLPDQPHERLIDELGGLECVTLALASHGDLGNAMEFREDDRGEAIGRTGHAALNLGEDRGDVQVKTGTGNSEQGTGGAAESIAPRRAAAQTTAKGPKLTTSPGPPAHAHLLRGAYRGGPDRSPLQRHH